MQIHQFSDLQLQVIYVEIFLFQKTSFNLALSTSPKRKTRNKKARSCGGLNNPDQTAKNTRLEANTFLFSVSLKLFGRLNQKQVQAIIFIATMHHFCLFPRSSFQPIGSRQPTGSITSSIWVKHELLNPLSNGMKYNIAQSAKLTKQRIL